MPSPRASHPTLRTELIDYGYPQTTEIDALKLIVLQKGYVNQEKVRWD